MDYFDYIDFVNNLDDENAQVIDPNKNMQDLLQAIQEREAVLSQNRQVPHSGGDDAMINADMDALSNAGFNPDDYLSQMVIHKGGY